MKKIKKGILGKQLCILFSPLFNFIISFFSSAYSPRKKDISDFFLPSNYFELANAFIMFYSYVLHVI